MGALIFTALSLGATRDQIAVTDQSQVTDRYMRAVEQLDKSGNEHLQARIGAIYALERLARDSSRDQPTIVEMLAAFIRSNTGRQHVLNSPCPGDGPIAADVQAALTVLGRRNRDDVEDGPIDLEFTCLAGADLHDAHLPGALFLGAILTEVDFRGADLSGANFIEASFRGTNFFRAIARDAMLQAVHLEYSSLSSANFERASFVGSYLNHSALFGADFRGADFSSANLKDSHHDDRTVTTGAIVTSDTVGAWW